MTIESESPSIIEFPMDRRDTTTYYECSLSSRVVMFWFNTMVGIDEEMFDNGSQEKICFIRLRDQLEFALDEDSGSYLNPGISEDEIEVMGLITQDKRERIGARPEYKFMIQDMMQEVESSFSESRKRYVNSKR